MPAVSWNAFGGFIKGCSRAIWNEIDIVRQGAPRRRTLNVDQGSVAFWVRPLWLRENGTGQCLFAWWTDPEQPGVDCLSLLVHPTGLETDHDWRNRLLFTRTRGRRHDAFSVKSFPLCEWMPGTWHHVVAAWNAGDGHTSAQLLLYLDGRALPTTEAPWGSRTTPTRLSIGYCWGAYADAAVDEIGLFRRVLTPAEVDYLFHRTSAGW